MGRGRPCFPPDFSCPAVLTLMLHRGSVWSPTGLSPPPVGSSNTVRLTQTPCGDDLAGSSQHRVQPRISSGGNLNTLIRFGLLPVRSPLLRESSLFLGVREMFQFPRFPPPPKRSVICLQMGLPHSDSVGSSVASTSPTLFAAWPRPSSALDAQASTMCSSLTMSCLWSSFFVVRAVKSVSPSATLANPAGSLQFNKVRSRHRSACLPGWSRGDSNPGPPPCKGGALPAKLRPPPRVPHEPIRGRAWTRTRDLGLIRAAL